MNFLPEFGNTLYMLAAFIVALSVIVAIHEYGHYIVGRWTGIKAEVFSLGFGPVLLSRVDKHGTRWQVAALPFGGYVRFKGDGDAASASADEAALRGMNARERRETMQGAPVWARALTVAAGPVFNFILSILLFAMLLLFRGDVAEPLTVGALRPLPAQAAAEQLQAGDQILAIDGQEVPAFSDTAAMAAFTDALPVARSMDYRVQRGTDALNVEGPYLYPPVILQLAPNSAAYTAGLEIGDVITSVDGQEIFAFDQLKALVEGSAGNTLDLEVWRAGEEAPPGGGTDPAPCR
ncbi:hypothetical protein PSAL_007260 [Pseudooceanicola algae]|uniref:PDZ domain-containing protein n=1 Tax=Pseudooceanicola algae TaxID=1537215 RepID=A0A418SDS7_9RHOB|nr:hypothetical protein PSAL_007260 [Pseudooceanicola algae]